MHVLRQRAFVAACIFALSSAATAQNQQRGQPQPAKPAPYKPVAVTAPQAPNDAALEALRKQLGEVAQHKDRAALTKLVVGQGFFWIGEKGDRADKRKSGIDNLAAALGLKNKDGAGWDMLASFADDPTGAPLPNRTRMPFARLPTRVSTARLSTTCSRRPKQTPATGLIPSPPMSRCAQRHRRTRR